MAGQQQYLRFAWWNLNNFAHYDPSRAAEERWPLEPAEYATKCARVDAALRGLVAQHPPDLLGLCEITPTAAEELQRRLFPDYRLLYPDTLSGSTFQVAGLYRRSMGFRNRLPLDPVNVVNLPRTTRAMLVFDHLRAGHCVRFILCHWTAFGDNSQFFRERLAEAVAEHAYQFLTNTRRTATAAHVVILGDLNEEPFGEVFRTRLAASRDRERATQRASASDRDLRRIRLYNAGWRLLGERHPHGSGTQAHFAGTYYNHSDRSWHTYDQALVSGSLLGTTPPYLDEASFGIMALPGCLEPNGKPEPFQWLNGQPSGLSDHLPLVGQITLPPG